MSYRKNFLFKRVSSLKYLKSEFLVITLFSIDDICEDKLYYEPKNV